MTAAITYQSGPRKNDLRTVLVEGVSRTIVLLPTGRLEVLRAKLLEGTSSAHKFWAEQLGTDPADHDFICPADSVRAIREVGPARIKKGCRK